MVILEADPIEALSPAELVADMAAAAAALADIEARYARDRDGILRWLGPDAAKRRLLARLEASRLGDREELVEWLSEAHRLAAAAPPARTPAAGAPAT